MGQAGVCPHSGQPIFLDNPSSFWCRKNAVLHHQYCYTYTRLEKMITMCERHTDRAHSITQTYSRWRLYLLPCWTWFSWWWIITVGQSGVQPGSGMKPCESSSTITQADGSFCWPTCSHLLEVDESSDEWREAGGGSLRWRHSGTLGGSMRIRSLPGASSIDH